MRLIILTILFLSLILGIRYAFYINSLETYAPGDSIVATVTLLSEPRQNAFGQTFRIGEVTIQAPQEPEFHYGDTIKINGKVEDGTFINSDGKRVMQLVVKKPEIEILPTGNPFITSGAWIRRRIQTAFDSYLPSQEASLLFGIVFGGSQGFNKENYEAFRNAGVLHVVAASGMNVTMVSAFLFAIFGRFFKRQHAIVAALAGVFYYALISGFSASVVRAAIMGSVAFTAGIIGRRNMAVLSLVLTVFIMLFVSPGLIFDVGFWLSVTSTLGILFIKPIFDRFKLFRKAKTVSDDITTSLSAQAGSIPVMASVFGTYSLVSIFANALVLWTIPILMILGGVAALVCLLFPAASIPFLYLAYPFLLYFKYIVIWFAGFPLLQVSNVPIVFWVGYYLILIALILNFNTKKDNY